MPPKIDQAAIIVLDVGKNVASPDEKLGKSFFEEAKECAARILERKIISQGKNLVSILLLGSKNSENNLHEQSDGNFKYIEMLAELRNPTWELIRNLPSEPSKKKGDWIDALLVAVDHFQNGTSGFKIMDKKIILMTNFKSPTYEDQNGVKKILNGFQEESITVDLIGPDLYQDSEEDFEIARQFVECTGGATATFDNTMRYLLFHKKKSVNAIPWNVDLNIGPNIKIPISSYIKSKDEPAVTKWKKAVKDPITTTASATEGIIKQKTLMIAENQSVVEKDAIIKGHHYGQNIIPDNNIKSTYESGEKGLYVYGFTNKNNVKWENLTGNGVSYVFGRKGDKKAQYAIRCLVECLQELKLAAVVRRVYINGAAPKMYVLMPVIDSDNYISLSMIEICYRDDIKYMSFPTTNLKKYECSNKQVEAFKELIKAMDLSNAYDETYDDNEAFPIAETVSPSIQYILDCISFRAMNPGKPLPQPRDDIMALFKIPPLLEKKSREPLHVLKDLFTLKKIECKTRVKKENSAALNMNNNAVIGNDHLTGSVESTTVTSDIPRVTLPIKTNEIDSIGTEHPIRDFEALMEKKQTLSDLSPQMTKAIERLFNSNFDGNYGNALKTLKYFREKCVQTDPSYYNTWYGQFKTSLTDCKNEDILEVINNNKLSFILQNENVLSTYDNMDSHEDSQLYENDTVPDMTEITVQSDVRDMFDEM
ncbi:X-ray repair cross-complementing protein 5 [Aphomia sociella]